MREIQALLGRFDAREPTIEQLDPLLHRVLEEDHAFEDRSSDPLPCKDQRRTAVIVAKAQGILAGRRVFQRVFELVSDGSVRLEGQEDGTPFRVGDTVLRVEAPAGALLAGERTALNFVQRLSGVATRTRDAVERVDGRIAISDTRKTTPGLRALEKYAVVVGGGTSHRWSLGDMVMLKENHLCLAGGIEPAVRAVRASDSASLPLTVEVTNFTEALQAAELAVDRILLDNMSVSEMRRVADAVEDWPTRPELEASGGLTLDDLPEVSRSGVDLVSLGSLTYSVPSIDLSFLLESHPTLPSPGGSADGPLRP